jgi:hypothetical protein
VFKQGRWQPELAVADLGMYNCVDALTYQYEQKSNRDEMLTTFISLMAVHKLVHHTFGFRRKGVDYST